MSNYVHGYSPREAERLRDQADVLAPLLHHDTGYPAGSTVLEVGCGTGSQTVTLAAHSPGAHITAVDIADASLARARARIDAAGLTNVTFQRADILAPPFAPETFDHVFVCFVLEHIPEPLRALQAWRRFVRAGGTITVIEGDHASAYYHPDSDAAWDAICCQVELQKRAGGDAMIGRRLYPLLCDAQFTGVHVSPRMVYVDASRPDLVEGFTKRTFTAMIEGVREPALAAGLISADRFDRGIRDLYRTTHSDGTFCYTFFKATGTR